MSVMIAAVLWQKVLTGLALIVVLGGLLLGLLYVFQEQIIFYPSTLTESEAEQITAEHERAEEVNFQAEGDVRLHGWLVHPEEGQEESQGLLIYYGGNAEELSMQIPEMASELPDWSILLVNYRGYGLSGGSPDEAKMYNDALHVYDEMQQGDEGNPAQSVLMGRSIGTAIASHVGAERDVDGLILVSPFDSLKEVGQHHFPILPVKTLLRYDFDSTGHINEINAPILAMAAEEDATIPEERTEALLQKRDGDFLYEGIPGRDHNDLHFEPVFWESIHSFLSSLD